jgi:hypothetical protein
MDRGMVAGNGASDAELRQWLSEVFPVVARGAGLPRSMEKAASQAAEVVPVGTALRWVEMLGVGKSAEVRIMAQNTPDAAATLATPDGEQAIRGCEATQRVALVLRALQRVVKMVLAFWRAGGQPSRAAVRGLAVLGVSEVVPDAEAFREELAATMGVCQSSAVRLIESYGAMVVANEGEKVENIDRLISRSLTFGPWVRSFWLCLRLRIQETKRIMATGFDSGQPLWRLSLILREIAGRKGKAASGR